MYYKIISDGLISVIGTGSGGEQITEAEYNHIKSILGNRPAAPEGFGYRLTESLEWELYEASVIADGEVTEEDYQAALAAFGVNI